MPSYVASADRRIGQPTRLLVLGNLAILGLLGLMVVLASRASYDAHSARARQAVENLARTFSMSIASDLKQLDNALQSAAYGLNLLETAGRLDPKAAAAVIERQQSLVTQVDVMRYADASGIVQNSGSDTPVSIADRDYFRAARDRPQALAISDPLQGRIIKKWAIIVARARLDSQGRFRGVVFTNLSSDHFRQAFSDASIGPHGAMALRNSSLKLVARYTPDDSDPYAGIGTATISDELRGALNSGASQGFFTGRAMFDGVDRANAFQHVPGYPFAVVVGLATEDLYQPWLNETWRLAALTGLLEAVIVILSVLLYLQQRRQASTQEMLRRLAGEQQVMLDNELVGMLKLKHRTELWHNRALAKLFGYELGELRGQPTRMFFPNQESYDEVGRGYAALAAGRQYRTQMQMVHRDGHLFWVDLSGAPLPDGDSLWLMVDISAVKAEEEQARQLSLQDPLTGLANRVALTERLGYALNHASRTGCKLAVCFLDLDGFKAVNDAHGHDAGDKMLREVARRLCAGVRAIDVVARLGGDEFALVLDLLEDVSEVDIVLKRLLEALSESIALGGGREAGIGASIGVAFYPDHGTEAQTLIAKADAAMYVAKRCGKNRFEVHRS